MAVQVFLHRLVREMGGLVALLQGLDVLVFTGGIGENQPVIRQEACDQLAYLGLLIDPLANEQASRVINKGHPIAIHAADSSAEIWVLATDEGRVAAEQAVGLYSASLGV
jgi:acetate kinase